MKTLEFQNDSKQANNSLTPTSERWSWLSNLSWLVNLGSNLTAFFNGPGEPSISHIVDRDGYSCWRVEDPRTQRTYWFATEGEVRIWLERQYYPG